MSLYYVILNSFGFEAVDVLGYKVMVFVNVRMDELRGSAGLGKALKTDT